MLRLPVTHPRSLICFVFRGPRYPPRFVSRSLRLRSQRVGGCLPGQGQFLTGDPIAGLSLRGRERDLPGFQAIHPVPLPRSRTPAESTIPRLLTVSSMLPPLVRQRRLQRINHIGAIAGLQHLLPTVSRMVLPPSMQGLLPAGWLAFAGRELNPLDHVERFQITFSSPSPGFFLAQRTAGFPQYGCRVQMRMLPSSSLTDPDVQISRFRFFMEEPRSRWCRSHRIRDVADQESLEGGCHPRFRSCRFSYPLSFRGQVCETQSSLPCFPSTVLSSWHPSSLGRVPVKVRFPDVTGRIEVLRLPSRIPGRLFVSLPGPTLTSSVRVSQLALALPEGRRLPSGPGSIFNRLPDCRFALTWT